MNITSIKANLLDLVCDIFSLGTPNYDRTQVESAIDLLYEVIIYRQQDSSIDEPCVNAPAAMIIWSVYPGISDGSASALESIGDAFWIP